MSDVVSGVDGVSPAGLSLEGRVALVTGASKGIGLAIATAFVNAGAAVMLSSRKAEGLTAAAAGLAGATANFPANAGDADAAVACVAATLERFGRLDILVNNAATNPYMGPTIEVDTARWDKTMQVNLRGPLLWTQAAWRAAMAEHGGSVINVASIGGLRHGAGIGTYDVSKAGLLHLTRVLAAELSPGVRVNALAPGLVRTDFARALLTNEEQVTARIPLARVGEPADIAGAALWLASDLSSWMTGETIVVDGGALLH